MLIATFRFPLFSADDPCMCANCADCQARAKEMERLLSGPEEEEPVEEQRSTG